MTYRMLSVFTTFVTVLIVQNYAENTNVNDFAENCPSNLLNIQGQIYKKMVTIAADLIGNDGSEKNIQYFPITQPFRTSYEQIYIYRANKFHNFISKERFFEVALTFAKLTKKIQTLYVATEMKTTGVYLSFQVNVSNDLCDPGSSLRECIEKESVKSTVISTLNKQPPVDLVNTTVQFSGCWSRPMYRLKSDATATVGYVYNYIAPGQRYNDRPTFYAIGNVDYYDNINLKYRAIRLPLGNEDFALYVVLPYDTQSLSMFSTFYREDYVNLFENVNQNFEKTAVYLPAIDIPMVTIDERGVDINSDNRKKCDASLVKNDTYTDNPDVWALENQAKIFYPSRPFAVFLVFEELKYVVWQAYIKNTREYLIPDFSYPIPKQ